MLKWGETNTVLSSATAVDWADTSATTLQRVFSETLVIKLARNFDVLSVKTLNYEKTAETKNVGHIFLFDKS